MRVTDDAQQHAESVCVLKQQQSSGGGKDVIRAPRVTETTPLGFQAENNIVV